MNNSDQKEDRCFVFFERLKKYDLSGTNGKCSAVGK